jgi:hypothetical protein
MEKEMNDTKEAEALEAAAEGCCEWHGCATGDCPHDKYVDCFEAVFKEGWRARSEWKPDVKAAESHDHSQYSSGCATCNVKASSPGFDSWDYVASGVDAEMCRYFGRVTTAEELRIAKHASKFQHARDAEEILSWREKNLGLVLEREKLTEENQRLRDEVAKYENLKKLTDERIERDKWRVQQVKDQAESISKLTAVLELFLTLKPRTGEEYFMHQAAREALASDRGAE